MKPSVNAMQSSGALRERLQRAVAHHRQGQLAHARALYEAVLVEQPQQFDALHMLGVIALQSRDPELALRLIGAAIAVHRGSAAAYSNHGSALEALGRWDEALGSFARAIALDPRHVEAQFNRANLLFQRQQYDAALAGFERVIALQPALLAAHLNRGNTLRRLGRWAEAGQSYERAIALDPAHAEAHLSRGLVFKELQQLSAALACYGRAIALKPAYAEAHSNRGNVQKALRQWDAALQSYDRAIASAPDFAEAHFNKGVTLQELGRCDTAVACYDEALRIRPDYVEAHANRGNALTEQNRLDDALASYDRALALEPHHAPGHFNRAIAHLLAGNLESGWRDYQWRWQNQAGSVINEAREFDAPLWLGAQSLDGKTILLHGEQGLGDMLQFCRYASSVALRGATVLLEVKAPLVALCATLPGVARVLARGEALPPIDYHCPLMSLPLAFGTTLQNMPGSAAYLRADPGKVAHWRARLQSGSRPRVGLVWSGNARQRNDHKRSLPLALLLAYLPADIDYVCLQTDVRDSDRAALVGSGRIQHFGEELNFDHTAAVCAGLDLVVGVCTSIVHLSAALGRPTWVLLPFNPDWRWLLGRRDSPWYASVTLYRQAAPGDWESALRPLAEDLRRRFDSGVRT